MAAERTNTKTNTISRHATKMAIPVAVFRNSASSQSGQFSASTASAYASRAENATDCGQSHRVAPQNRSNGLVPLSLRRRACVRLRCLVAASDSASGRDGQGALRAGGHRGHRAALRARAGPRGALARRRRTEHSCRQCPLPQEVVEASFQVVADVGVRRGRRRRWLPRWGRSRCRTARRSPDRPRSGSACGSS